MERPRKAVRVGLPILVIGLLALAALWRVGAPADARRTGSTGSGTTGALETLTQITDVEEATSILRKASLENVRVRELPSPRTAWIDSGSAPLAAPSTERVFAVLDPDVKRSGTLQWEPGTRVTLIGLVRPSPAVADAMRQWSINESTALELQQRGTYLHVTEILAVTNGRNDGLTN
jgi:hypothetical protein